MWDVCICIILFNTNWWIHFEYLAMTGFPLTFLVLYVLWLTQCLPMSMYDTDVTVNLWHVGLLFLFMDVLQTTCHYAAHTRLRHTPVGRSHMIHHVHKNPLPQDAFFTGSVDAIFQLILPLVLSLHLVQPSKYTASLFGCFYSWWLLFIHSNADVPWLSRLGLVTPRHHRQHHHNPSTNFSTFFKV